MPALRSDVAGTPARHTSFPDDDSAQHMHRLRRRAIDTVVRITSSSASTSTPDRANPANVPGPVVHEVTDDHPPASAPRGRPNAPPPRRPAATPRKPQAPGRSRCIHAVG